MNMNVMGGVGGPVGGQQMMNMGTPGNAPGGNGRDDTHRNKLHTYMYDYFLRNGMFDMARMLLDKVEIETADPKQSPGQRNMNGDSMEQDSKDNILGKPDDLPMAKVAACDASFLLDWWGQFWDCYLAQRGRGTQQTKQYLTQVQNAARMQNNNRNVMVNPQMQMMRNPMMAQGNDMKKPVAMNGNRPMTQQQMQQLQHARQQQMIMQSGQMMPQTQMQREGSSMDGQQRPQTPGSGENAPSPKRQRIDGGSFNGQMPPMGRGQPQGMPNQQGYAQSMRQQMQNAMDVNSDKGMQNPNGPLQGSPAMDANADFFNNGQMRGMPGAGPAGQNSSNHALQNYQMQLMLLEQQNKKRLLMARQEQESAPNGPNSGPMPGFNAPAMSPSNSRTGPSPNPDEQMKRGTPKMAPGIPPNPDGSMPQGRGSPVPGFDPSQMNPNIAPVMFNQMAKMQGMMGGPNGQMNGQMMPATSHPAMMNGQGPPMNQQQTFEMMQQRGVQRPGGPWPQGPPQMMQGQQPPQPPNMTPQQRNAAMPPPPAPPQGEAARTQPSSPSQSQQAPPTPSQTNKANPKGKKEGAKNNKKAPAKKGGAAAATPASEGGEQPPTPTPAPPITPTAPAQQFKIGPNQQPNQQGQNPGAPGQQQQTDLGQPFGALDGSNGFDMSLDFGALDGQDVLEQFDFDSFLNNENADNSFAFDPNMNFDGGLEAGGDV